MRVVHVLHSFGTGGLEKGVVTVVRRAAPDVEHVVLCLTRSGESARALPGGTAVIELGKPGGNSLRFLVVLARRLRALAPAVVHTRNWGGVDGIVASRLAGLRGVVHGEHGWEMGDPHGTLRRRVRIRRLTSRWVREYTCVSRQIASWLREQVGVRRPVTQIYNGVDTASYRPDAGDRVACRARLGLPAGGFVAAVVGRLDPIKNHATLFAAFAGLHARDPEARLLVVGDGPERERLTEQAGAGVVLLGNRADVPQILRAVDVFVLPSWNEGISNTILEAMASGVPVLATRVGGNPELVDDGVTGILVPAGDAAALERALERYRVDPGQARAQGAAGRTRAVERFDPLEMTRAYEDVWRRVADGQSAVQAAERTGRS